MIVAGELYMNEKRPQIEPIEITSNVRAILENIRKEDTLENINKNFKQEWSSWLPNSLNDNEKKLISVNEFLDRIDVSGHITPSGDIINDSQDMLLLTEAKNNYKTLKDDSDEEMLANYGRGSEKISIEITKDVRKILENIKDSKDLVSINKDFKEEWSSWLPNSLNEQEKELISVNEFLDRIDVSGYSLPNGEIDKNNKDIKLLEEVKSKYQQLQTTDNTIANKTNNSTIGKASSVLAGIFIGLVAVGIPAIMGLLPFGLIITASLVVAGACIGGACGFVAARLSTKYTATKVSPEHDGELQVSGIEHGHTESHHIKESGKTGHVVNSKKEQDANSKKVDISLGKSNS